MDSNDDNLCAGCRACNLEHRIQQRCTAHFGSVDETPLKQGNLLATIVQSELNPACTLCQQYRDILSALSKNASKSGQEAHLKLYWYRLSVEQPAFYVKCYCLNVAKEVRLFPADRLSTKRCSWTACSTIGKIVVAQEPDFGRIKQELQLCKDQHGSVCRVKKPKTLSLRLIDCMTRQLVEGCTDKPYICLSYVWGSTPTSDFAKDGVLPDNVPKTVEDALYVAVALGIPYLWVDRYCIDQSHAQEKHDLIRQMDQIYQGAEITIVASVGDDPSYGLPGVRGTKRQQQIQLRLGGLVLAEISGVQKEILTSRWASRGWTYQEMLLSRRRLVFTTTQMYFQCGARHTLESTSFRHSSMIASVPNAEYKRVFPTVGDDSSISELRQALIEYFPKQLSYATDTIDAFSGVINSFSAYQWFNHGVSHFYGIPIYHQSGKVTDLRPSLLNGLGWSIGGNWDRLSHFNDMFPSWSWASEKSDAIENMQTNVYPAHWAIPLDSEGSFKDITISITANTGETADISILLSGIYNYKDFLPEMKITTWVRYGCARSIDEEDKFSMIIDRPDFRSSTKWNEVDGITAVCLSTTKCWRKGYAATVGGLLVVKAGPKSCRRVGVFSLEIENEDYIPSASDVDSSETSKSGGGVMSPDFLERLGTKSWQRRSLHLV